MRESFTERWATALESGAYTQGVGFFRRRTDAGEVCHCVLGVAVDLLIQDGHADPWRENEDGVFDSNGYKRFADSRLFARMGIDPASASALSVANDKGQPFDALARMIRRLGAKR